MDKTYSKSSNSSNTDFLKSDKLGVVSTKLNKPSVPSNYVNRTTLFERFDKNLHLPLTLVSAATGCGKSTTVSQWLDTKDFKYGWLSIDTEHNDVQVIIAYLTALLKKAWPEKTFDLEYLLNGINVPLNVIISTLINDIAQLDERFVLVLDDYHLIREEKIHEIFNEILRHPPENLHMVIITQMDPPLRLASLRAKLQLNELRMKDLAFTIDEAFELRSLIAGEADNNQVKSLVQKSEGWVTAITIGLMGLAEGIKFEKVLEAMHSRNSIIAELLDEAVLNGLLIETQKYLELATLVDQFSEDLIRVMVASIDDKDLIQSRVEDLIRTSRKRNLFLIPLDNSGEWYRFHPLFQSQVRKLREKYFNEDTVSLLYKAASNWFEEKKLLEEALKYAMSSKDMAFAVRLFARFRHELHNTEKIQRLERLIKLFPEEAINNSPEILLSLAMLRDYNANYAGMQKYLLRAEELLKTIDSPTQYIKEMSGEYHSVHTILSIMFGELDQALINAEKAMQYLPADKPNFYREFAAGWYSFTQQIKGNTKDGLDRLNSEFGTLGNSDQYFQRRLLQGRCMIQLLEGNALLMGRYGAALTLICSPDSFPISWMTGIYSETTSHYLNNDLEKVNKHHNNLELHRYLGLPFWVIHHFFIEDLSAMAMGKWQELQDCIDQCSVLSEELAIEPLKGMVNAFKVEYYLRRNDIELANQVSILANFEPHPPLFFYYIPQLTQVKLFYRTNKKEKANELLQNLLNTGKQGNNKNLLIQALALQAVIHNSEGNIETAKKVLNDVLMITKETKNIRVFLDHGEAMHQMLQEMVKVGPESSWVHKILQAFEDELPHDFKDESKSTANREKQINDLSNREMEILALVTCGLKNDEIAQKLFISTDTVKKHLYRTYQKLNVKNRTSAIKKAKAIGLVASNLEPTLKSRFQKLVKSNVKNSKVENR